MHTSTRKHFAFIEWTECAAFILMIIATTMIADICSFPSCFLADAPFLMQHLNIKSYLIFCLAFLV